MGGGNNNFRFAFLEQDYPLALDRSHESLSQGEDVYLKIYTILGITQIITKAYQNTYLHNVNA